MLIIIIIIISEKMKTELNWALKAVAIFEVAGLGTKAAGTTSEAMWCGWGHCLQGSRGWGQIVFPCHSHSIAPAVKREKHIVYPGHISSVKQEQNDVAIISSRNFVSTNNSVKCADIQDAKLVCKSYLQTAYFSWWNSTHGSWQA